LAPKINSGTGKTSLRDERGRINASSGREQMFGRKRFLHHDISTRNKGGKVRRFSVSADGFSQKTRRLDLLAKGRLTERTRSSRGTGWIEKKNNRIERLRNRKGKFCKGEPGARTGGGIGQPFFSARDAGAEHRKRQRKTGYVFPIEPRKGQEGKKKAISTDAAYSRKGRKFLRMIKSRPLRLPI